jgi:hypothetical protein
VGTKKLNSKPSGPSVADLSGALRYKNYTEAIARMYDGGLISKETAKTMLVRVDNLIGEELRD